MKLGALQISVASVLLLGLTACGSGGGGGAAAPAGPVASTLSFPLQTGYTTLIANGQSRTFTISGYCSGSGTRTTAPATTSATFEGLPALSSVTTLSGSYTNCTPTTFAQTSTSYVNSSYLPMGFNSVGVNYGVWSTPTVPSTVTVGATAVIGTETLYTDSTKAVGDGRIDESFVIEADTANTAIVNLIAKIYNASSVLTATEQDRYRITSTGALSIISTDIQNAIGSGNTNHFLWTYN